MKYPLDQSCQNRAGKEATSSERGRSVRGERKNLCRVEVVDQTIPLANSSFDVSASLLSG